MDVIREKKIGGFLQFFYFLHLSSAQLRGCMVTAADSWAKEFLDTHVRAHTHANTANVLLLQKP